MRLIDSKILKSRNASIDVYRGIAILLVVLFHFEHLVSVGFIGVDLFFVISGYLVSKALLKEIDKGQKINWKSFFIKRATKILPSYYFFIFAGTILARLLLLESNPDQVIPFNELPRYLFFYLNYNMTFSWSFELAWSLCVEEHFYIFLVLVFLLLSVIALRQKRLSFLKILLFAFIGISILFKILGHFYDWDTYSATHMRMDALFLGVLLSFQEINEKIIKVNSIPYALIGFLILTIAIGLFYTTLEDSFFRESLFHTLIPISFYCIIRGTLFSKFKGLKFLRVLAYYSYNWYLWHAIVGFLIINKLNLPIYYALPLYLIATFAVAVFTTKIVEEPILKTRTRIMQFFKL